MSKYKVTIQYKDKLKDKHENKDKGHHLNWMVKIYLKYIDKIDVSLWLLMKWRMVKIMHNSSYKWEIDIEIDTCIVGFFTIKWVNPNNISRLIGSTYVFAFKIYQITFEVIYRTMF